MFPPDTFPRWDWNRATPPDRHVLVAEDHLGQQVRAASKFMSMFGGDGRVQVSLVPGGLYAAAIIMAKAPNLLILDHDMPDGNGQALLNWMVSSGNVHVPVITFSGIAENNRRMASASAPLFRSFHAFSKEEVLTGAADGAIYSSLEIAPP